ncbi:RdRP-domain-containing protein [Russula emetica]|nr:RdRP-domain-containing protein [Russula emetica]
MEIELTRISFEANVYDVRKAVADVLHGPDLFDPNDRENKGRVPNFDIIMGISPAGRIHNGKAILRVASNLGRRLLKWSRDSRDHNIEVKGKPLRIFNLYTSVPPDVKQTLEKALYIDPEKDRLRSQIEEEVGLVRARIAKVQFGVWYRPSDSPSPRRTFSIEHERDFLSNSAAYIYVVYEHKLIHIDIGQRETEEVNYMILIKFSSIHKLGIGYDEFGQAFIILDLRTPPNFEQESYNGRAPEGIERKGKFKTRDRISAIDSAHARVAPYAHHLRILLADPEDLTKFENICDVAQCEPRPIRVPPIDAHAKGFFSHRDIVKVQRWIKTMDWKNAFQIEAYLRSGLLTTHDLLHTLQKPIEEAIRYYGNEASEFLRLFSVELKMCKPDEEVQDCFARLRSKHVRIEPLRLARGHISCHHVIITPSRILLEGPYTTQSNRVIRLYQSHDPSLAERFVRVEFRDEDRLAYRWDRDVDGTWFLKQRVGGTLRNGFEIGGRAFEFLAYSTSALREHSVWFVNPFRDPVEGYVTSEKIRTSLGDFSKLLRMPSKYAARIAQAFTATVPSVKIRSDQWEEQPDLGEHTDGVGTISPLLRDIIWEAMCKAFPHLRGRVPPSALQFRYLGYKGVVVVDHRLQGIKMRLRESQRKFPVHDVDEAEFEIATAFDYPNPVHLNRPVVMALEDRGVDKDIFIKLQEEAKADIYLSSDSLEQFSRLLTKHNLGGKFHLAFILEQLGKLGLDFKDNNERKKKAVGGAFVQRLLRFSMNHSLREVKFKARIPVPKSYQLVGVADEGQAYIKEGVNEEDVFTLSPGRIFVCVQENANEPPKYFKGTCVISRSPVIHPGDVQRVYAVGEPPEDKICFFRHLKNVVVLPAVGDRSLASCLAGGDLDGDTYDVYYDNPGLIPQLHWPAMEMGDSTPRTLDEDREDATVDDICDFIVEYINSDVMGLLADRHIVIADQSKDGVFDDRCMKLATLCSQAVDYAKNGNPVELHNNLPKKLIKFSPDWHKAEVTGARELDYYVSDRALGYMFRNIELLDPEEPIEGLPTEPPEAKPPLKDPISHVLAPLVQRALHSDPDPDPDGAEPDSESENDHVEQLHEYYVGEMRYICVTHTLVDAPDVRLKEEEVVLGTILANCAQPRWRSDRTYRMRLHVESLVDDIRGKIVQNEETLTEEQFRSRLSRAWAVWAWAQHHHDTEFIESFSLIALGLILDNLKRLNGLPQA